ncbi:MAG: tRNA dihydrouridine(20/20a) synthase DusA [Alphaproteobacteria bacterium]|nr:tRNA dihydrouridine(20/20a) synthase DusA [Alphaproteobacteria bacterium]
MMLNDHAFSVAPMMDWTDRHCRYFHRRMTARARLYTEMVVADAAIHGDRNMLMGSDPSEGPVALQLGGAEPGKLAEAARIGEGFGYDEINLNVGCPSDRVQSGTFGACLMRTPELVAECVAAMARAASVPITVKCRIGVDDQDPEESLFSLVDNCAAAGVETFIVHARKAWLQGLSPKQNRDVPPLDYGLVKRLKEERPRLRVILNGGLKTVEEAKSHLGAVDGAMLGRAAYQTPRLLLDVDREIFGDEGPARRIEEIVVEMEAYIRRVSSDGVRPHHVLRHMQGLAHGLPGARAWRRMLTEKGAATDVGALARAHASLRAAIEAASSTAAALDERLVAAC